MVVAIFTGHAPVRWHLYIVGLFDGDSTCRFCRMETETVQHIICSCEALARLRYNVFGKLTAEPKDISTVSVRGLCLFIRGKGLLNLSLMEYLGVYNKNKAVLHPERKKKKEEEEEEKKEKKCSKWWNSNFINNWTLTYLLTPWCRVLLEKLTGLQLVKKFPAFHGTPRFINALTSVRHLSLSWANPIQSTYPHPTSWRSIPILSGFPTRTLYAPLSSPIRATCPAHLILLDFITRTILGEEYRSLRNNWKLLILFLPRWCLHLHVVGEFESFRDPESYAGGSIATGRDTQAGQVKG